jgi:hypothetical protein
MKVFTDGFLTHGRWHARVVILFKSMRSAPAGEKTEFAPDPAL